MNEISQNLFSSHHATNPVCAPSTAVDSHLVAFNTRHTQPKGTNYSSVSSMLQCLQRTVLEKHSYFAWQEKPSKTKEGALCDERRVHPKSNKSEQFGKLDMLWWKIVKTQVYFLSGSPHRIVLLCGPEAWLPFQTNASEITRTRCRLSRWEPAAERGGRGSPPRPLPGPCLLASLSSPAQAPFSHAELQQKGIPSATLIKIPPRDENRVGVYRQDGAGSRSSAALRLCPHRHRVRAVSSPPST